MAEGPASRRHRGTSRAMALRMETSMPDSTGAARWAVPSLVPGRTGGTVPVRPPRSMSILSIALLIFIVLDPFGNMVTLNTLLGALPAARRRRVMFRESLIALGILLLF